MTELSQTTRIRPTVTHAVYRRAIGAGDPLVNGEETGWTLDSSLRCEQVRWDRGVRGGFATFGYVPASGALPGFQAQLSGYGVDDQVRVYLLDCEVPSGFSIPEGGFILFEGVLRRQSFRALAQGKRDDEAVTLTAVATPRMDDEASSHIVHGRAFRSGSTWAMTETASLPACFNFRGKPNRDDSGTVTSAAINGTTFAAHMFTHDQDPDGEYWTLNQAIRHLLLTRLVGSAAAAKSRMTTVEATTLSALKLGLTAGQWEGLDARLPEVDVTGLGVYSAIARVCRAAGFGMAITPQLNVFASGSVDRSYGLELWRLGAAPAVVVAMQAAGAHSGDAATDLAANNVNRIDGMIDAQAVINEAFVTGRELIECTLPLKPLWAPGDVDTTTPDGTFQESVKLHPTQTYHKRYVVGGSDFADYAHVGRMWGIDCTGEFASSGYSSGAYQHASGGYDWMTYLGIDNSTDAITADRLAAGVADPIWWSTRLRHLLPLTRPSERAAGRDFVLEVSEDGGSTWTRIDLEVRTLRGWCGIQLVGPSVANLANINLDTLASSELPPVAESWWQLILDNDLLFRVTGCVEADHGLVRQTARGSGAGSKYKRGEAIYADEITRVWAAPSAANSIWGSTAFVEVPGDGVTAPTTSDDPADMVADIADRTVDAGEALRIPMTCYSWRIAPLHWRIGGQVEEITGRAFDLTAAGGRSASIVAVDWTLSPEAEQGVTIHLHDETRVRGV